MDQKAGAQISKRSFLQAVVILFVLMMLAGLLTLIIPAGHYARSTLEGAKLSIQLRFKLFPNPIIRSGAGSRLRLKCWPVPTR